MPILMKTKFYVYIHCKPNGDPFYVGKGSGRRSREFKLGRNQHYKNTVAKYGKNKIEVLIFPKNSENEALITESKWIYELRQAGFKLCNQTDGGDGVSGHKHTEEIRAKISASKKGRKRPPFSEEAKNNMAESHKGNINRRGKKASQTTLLNMSTASKLMWAKRKGKMK